MKKKHLGHKIHNFCKKLWPHNRSITGYGTLQTLHDIKKEIKDLKIISIKSGYKAFDWSVPKEWVIKEAWIKNSKNKKIIDFSKCNLHVLNYSYPINKKLKYSELIKNIYTLPNQPTAIPYVTSYYVKNWGFCMSDSQKRKLNKKEVFHAFIDSKFIKGNLYYGELLIKGKVKKEIFLSSYICHPSLANNELSGPSVLTYLAKRISKKKNYYSYRIIFVPETIGSICYISKNLKKLKQNVIAGFNLSCVGDNRTYSYLPSRIGNSMSDKIALHVLKNIYPKFKKYSWNDRGSDERQYCSPGVDLPIATIMRTKYGEYPEYHTSLDDLKKVVTPDGLLGGYEAIIKAIEGIENNYFLKSIFLCEPKLIKRKLNRAVNLKSPNEKKVQMLLDLLTWADGKTSLLEIANKTNKPMWEYYNSVEILRNNNLIKLIRKNKCN